MSQVDREVRAAVLIAGVASSLEQVDRIGPARRDTVDLVVTEPAAGRQAGVTIAGGTGGAVVLDDLAVVRCERLAMQCA